MRSRQGRSRRGEGVADINCLSSSMLELLRMAIKAYCYVVVVVQELKQGVMAVWSQRLRADTLLGRFLHQLRKLTGVDKRIRAGRGGWLAIGGGGEVRRGGGDHRAHGILLCWGSKYGTVVRKLEALIFYHDTWVEWTHYPLQSKAVKHGIRKPHACVEDQPRARRPLTLAVCIGMERCAEKMRIRRRVAWKGLALSYPHMIRAQCKKYTV